MIDRTPVWIGLCDLALALLAVAMVSVNPKEPAKTGIENKALYLVTIEWPVDLDADVDNHVRTPSGKPTFYGSRDVGCSKLDMDYRGFMDENITLADGTTVKVPSAKETISIRCPELGHYDAAANLFAFRNQGLSQDSSRYLGVKVHAELIAIEPKIHVVFAKDVTLDYVGQTINWASFDMARNGAITLTEPPLTPVTAGYQTARP